MNTTDQLIMLRSLIESQNIRMAVEYADSNRNMEASVADGARGMNHFRCVLRVGRRQMTVPFSQGYGIRGEPTIASVLDCLASDAAGIENARGFMDWANDIGYDTDSRQAERTYRIIERQAKQLKRLLGDATYDVLLWHTERE